MKYKALITISMVCFVLGFSQALRLTVNAININKSELLPERFEKVEEVATAKFTNSEAIEYTEVVAILGPVDLPEVICYGVRVKPKINAPPKTIQKVIVEREVFGDLAMLESPTIKGFDIEVELPDDMETVRAMCSNLQQFGSQESDTQTQIVDVGHTLEKNNRQGLSQQLD